MNALISALLSLINPGLGQLRNGQLFKAILFYLLWYTFLLPLLWIDSYRTFQGLILMLSIYLGLHVYFVFDAFYFAFKSKTRAIKSYNKWFIYILIIILNSIVAIKYTDYINSNWITAHRVPTSSMEPTLYVGDYFIGDYQYYKSNAVKPGEVVILKFPRDLSIKYIERCIAVGGQIVEIRDKAVYVDDIYFQDSEKSQFIDTSVYSKDYIDPEIYPKQSGNRDNYGPITVPENHCFVLGDNRDNSFDSRYWGFVPLRLIVAKPLYIYWSINKNRIGSSIE